MLATVGVPEADAADEAGAADEADDAGDCAGLLLVGLELHAVRTVAPATATTATADLIQRRCEFIKIGSVDVDTSERDHLCEEELVICYLSGRNAQIVCKHKIALLDGCQVLLPIFGIIAAELASIYFRDATDPSGYHVICMQ